MTVEYEIFCGGCGKGICSNANAEGTTITVQPCKTCLEAQRGKYYTEGYDDGQTAGHHAGEKYIREKYGLLEDK